MPRAASSPTRTAVVRLAAIRTGGRRSLGAAFGVGATVGVPVLATPAVYSGVEVISGAVVNASAVGSVKDGAGSNALSVAGVKASELVGAVVSTSSASGP